MQHKKPHPHKKQHQQKDASQYRQPPVVNNPSAPLIFRDGGKGSLISKFNSKIVIVPNNVKLEAGKYYNCQMANTKGGNAYLVVMATPIKPETAKTSFRMGKSGNGLVGSFNFKVVIPAEGVKVETDKFYSCEVVLTPKGNAYLAQSAVETPAPVVEIVKYEYPVSSVEVKIDGRITKSLQFNATEHHSGDIDFMCGLLMKKDILNKSKVVQEYKQTCTYIMNKHKDRGYSRNQRKF